MLKTCSCSTAFTTVVSPVAALFVVSGLLIILCGYPRCATLAPHNHCVPCYQIARCRLVSYGCGSSKYSSRLLVQLYFLAHPWFTGHVLATYNPQLPHSPPDVACAVIVLVRSRFASCLSTNWGSRFSRMRSFSTACATMVLAAIGLLAIDLLDMACCYSGSFLQVLLVQSLLQPMSGCYLLAR